MVILSKLSVRSRIYFEDHDKVRKVLDQIKSSMKKQLGFDEVHEEGMCDVKIVLCPIVSRAGTDIEAALSRNSRCSGTEGTDKLTVMIVLHHTFSPEATVPNTSSRYHRRNMLMVDVLFHEDKGFLNCTRNEKALNIIADYLTRHCAQAPEPKELIKFMNFFRNRWCFWTGFALCAGILMYKRHAVCLFFHSVTCNLQDFIRRG